MSESYVIDASALVQYLIDDTDSARVDTIMSMLDDPNMLILCSIEFCYAECVNVLWKHVRFYGASSAESLILVNDLIDLPLHIYSARDLLVRALEIGLKHQLAVYDSVYIALAESLSLPLITTDAKQAAAAQVEGVTLKPIADFPEYVEPDTAP